MAFLNIVSLPAKIDEIRYSMSNNLIDLIAFNETRLDPNVISNWYKYMSGAITSGFKSYLNVVK